MIEPEDVGVPKGEGSDTLTGNRKVLIDRESIEEVIEILEDSQKNGETYLSHDSVRPSGHLMAVNAREAYRLLIEAHPDYILDDD